MSCDTGGRKMCLEIKETHTVQPFHKQTMLPTHSVYTKIVQGSSKVTSHFKTDQLDVHLWRVCLHVRLFIIGVQRHLPLKILCPPLLVHEMVLSICHGLLCAIKSELTYRDLNKAFKVSEIFTRSRPPESVHG